MTLKEYLKVSNYGDVLRKREKELIVGLESCKDKMPGQYHYILSELNGVKFALHNWNKVNITYFWK